MCYNRYIRRNGGEMDKQLTLIGKGPSDTKVLRVPGHIHDAVEEAAKKNGRSMTVQAGILLGAALNRNLGNPQDMKVIAEITSNDL